MDSTRSRVFAAALVACLAVGCPDGPTPRPFDVGSEPDAGDDATADGDTAVDAGTDTGSRDFTAQQTVAAGKSFSCALRDAQVRCWGTLEPYGPDKTTVLEPAPVSGLGDAVQIDAHHDSVCAVTSAGEVRCTGLLGGFSGTGNGPKTIENLASVRAVAAGGMNGCALRTDGAVVCFGFAFLDRDGMPDVSPVQIDEATQVVTTGTNACALHRDATVSCWALSTDAAPTLLDLQDVTRLEAGWGSICAVHRDGTVSCRGLLSGAEDGSFTRVDALEGVVDVAVADAAGDQTQEIVCGLGEEGGVRCLNFDEDGIDAEPTTIDGADSVVELDAGDGHFCGRRADDEVICWGTNDGGQLGLLPYAEHQGPSDVVGLTGATRLAASVGRTCALRDDASVWCWGAGRALAERVPGLDDSVSIGGGNFGICAVDQAGEVLCLRGEREPDPPVPLRDDGQITAVAVGEQHACLLYGAGRVACWGDGYNAEWYRPTPVEGLQNMTSVSVGAELFCALHADGGLSCWGRNEYGQVGVESSQRWLPDPQRLTDFGPVDAFTTGAEHACAVVDERVWCWGSNDDGQLGIEPSQVAVPTLVPDIQGATDVAAGGSRGSGPVYGPAPEAHTCAIADGRVICWGSNSAGQLGTDPEELAPVPGLDDAVSVVAGAEHTCALRANGEALCWGSNLDGQLGNGAVAGSATPVRPER